MVVVPGAMRPGMAVGSSIVGGCTGLVAIANAMARPVAIASANCRSVTELDWTCAGTVVWGWMPWDYRFGRRLEWQR